MVETAFFHAFGRLCFAGALGAALTAAGCDNASAWSERPGSWKAAAFQARPCARDEDCPAGMGCDRELGCLPRSDAENLCPERYRWRAPHLCQPWDMPCSGPGGCPAGSSCTDGYCVMHCSAGFPFCPPGFSCDTGEGKCRREHRCGPSGACPGDTACEPLHDSCYRRCDPRRPASCPAGHACDSIERLCYPAPVPCRRDEVCPPEQGCHLPTGLCAPRCGPGHGACPEGRRCSQGSGVCAAEHRLCERDRDCPPGGVCWKARAAAGRCYLRCTADAGCPGGSRCIPGENFCIER